jgi:hypothetical protein
MTRALVCGAMPSLKVTGDGDVDALSARSNVVANEKMTPTNPSTIRLENCLLPVCISPPLLASEPKSCHNSATGDHLTQVVVKGREALISGIIAGFLESTAGSSG